MADSSSVALGYNSLREVSTAAWQSPSQADLSSFMSPMTGLSFSLLDKFTPFSNEIKNLSFASWFTPWPVACLILFSLSSAFFVRDIFLSGSILKISSFD